MLAYLQEPTIAADENPLEWWRKHQLIYPTLAALAKAYLATPPSSASSERMFSVVAKIYNKSRNSLRDFRIEMLLFIRQNPHIIPPDSYQLAAASDVNKYLEERAIQNNISDSDSCDSDGDWCLSACMLIMVTIFVNCHSK